MDSVGVDRLAGILRNNAETIGMIGVAIEESGAEVMAEDLALVLLTALSVEGLEILPHQHDWLQVTLATNPPKERRTCQSCGRMEQYKPGEWVAIG